MPNRRIEVLTFDGCPNANAAQALVDHVVAGLGVEAEVASIRVPNVDAAERLRFLGSPTIRVDGCDVEPDAARRTDYALACRVYATAAGPSNLPDEEWLRAALSESSW
jgi:hypothetical protein